MGKFLTPNVPNRTLGVSVDVPDTILPLFLGAILELWDPLGWEVFGTCTIGETIDLVSDLFLSVDYDQSLVPGEVDQYKAFLYGDKNPDIYFLTDDQAHPLYAILDLGG